MRTKTKEPMSNLNQYLEEACYEVWGMARHNPNIKNEVTIWDVFRYLCLKQSGRMPRKEGSCYLKDQT